MREDLRHGLTGKSAIHPAQVAVIEREYRVGSGEYALARQILASDEAVHRNWAEAVLLRAAAFPPPAGSGEGV